MPVDAIQNISFTSKKPKSKEAESQNETKKDRYYRWVSQNQANEALKLSVGREVEDGKYKAVSAFATLGAFAAGTVTWFKGLKVADLMNEARTAAAQPKVDLGQLGKIDSKIAKNIKFAKAALIAVPILLAVSAMAKNINIRKAEKTAHERGFYTMQDRYKMKGEEEVYNKTNELYTKFTASKAE